MDPLGRPKYGDLNTILNIAALAMAKVAKVRGNL
jgi:hypothetical protein